MVSTTFLPSAARLDSAHSRKSTLNLVHAAKSHGPARRPVLDLVASNMASHRRSMSKARSQSRRGTVLTPGFTRSRHRPRVAAYCPGCPATQITIAQAMSKQPNAVMRAAVAGSTFVAPQRQRSLYENTRSPQLGQSQSPSRRPPACAPAGLSPPRPTFIHCACDWPWLAAARAEPVGLSWPQRHRSFRAKTRSLHCGQIQSPGREPALPGADMPYGPTNGFGWPQRHRSLYPNTTSWHCGQSQSP